MQAKVKKENSIDKLKITFLYIKSYRDKQKIPLKRNVQRS